ncbi:MAG: hypothetical protein Q4B50_06010, partial [Bacillota bacterium]|nr:hypothetical protein [Bacillota bacterium]
MLDLLGSAGSEIAGFLGDTVVDGLQSVLYATLYKVLYYIGWAVCQVLSLFNSMFEVVAGLNTVAYNGKSTYLINVFFSNSTVTKIYWGMALLGIVIAVGFAISAVIRKTFDSNDREKRSHGAILTSLFKAILLILSMNFIITAVVNATNVLMQQINYIFVNGEDLGKDESIEFTDEHFAAMARALNTIGNYSLNPSHNNRYNLNSCFNELRYDLLYLQQEGVFEFYYVTKDEEGNSIATWQSALQRIANSANLTQDLKMDVYYDSVSKAILDAMELLKVNSSLMPLESYERQYLTSRKSTPLDRVLFLMSTMRAAKNSEYNVNPSMTDPVRGPYYSGEKSIYNLDEVNEDFDIGITSTDYLLWYFMGYKLLFFLARIILNCIARIFNIMLLYLIAPPIIATMPQDDGAKFKQWMVAFVVQTFSVFGTVIAMRLLLVFVPIVLDGALVLFENALLNFLAKVVIVLAGFEVAEKATATITGILADNAGFQSIQAGDMGSVADKAMDVGEKYAKSALGGAVGLGGKTLKYGLMAGGIATGGALLGAAWGAYGVGKGIGALGGKIHNAWKNREGAGGDGGAPGGARESAVAQAAPG